MSPRKMKPKHVYSALSGARPWSGSPSAQPTSTLAQQKSTPGLQPETALPFSGKTDVSKTASGGCPFRGGLKKLKEMPGPKPSVPFIGTSWIYMPGGTYSLSDLHTANMDKYRRYGRILVEEFQWGRPYVQVYDPRDIESVLRQQGKYPLRPPNDAVKKFRLSQTDRYRNAGMVNTDGEEWYKLRSKFTPIMMRQKTVQHYLSAQNAICDDFNQLLRETRSRDNQVDDVLHELYKVALESVVQFCLDTRLGCLQRHISDDARIMIDSTLNMFTLYQDLYYGLPLWKLYDTPTYKKMGEMDKLGYSVASKYIDRAIERNAQSKSHQFSLLSELLSNDEIHPLDAKMTLFDFITAGIDTVSNTLAFILYQIASNPEVQSRLHREVADVISGDDVTIEALSQLPYLKACVRETFRLTPTIPNIVRITSDEIELCGYQLPKGVTIICHTLVTSRLPEYFPQPDQYIPDRWLSDNTHEAGKRSFQGTVHPFAVLPFGHGARMCPGRRFAEQEIYVTLAKIIKHFKLEPVGGLERVYRFLVSPKGPLPMKFISRQ